MNILVLDIGGSNVKYMVFDDKREITPPTVKPFRMRGFTLSGKYQALIEALTEIRNELKGRDIAPDMIVFSSTLSAGERSVTKAMTRLISILKSFWRNASMYTIDVNLNVYDVLSLNQETLKKLSPALTGTSPLGFAYLVWKRVCEDKTADAALAVEMGTSSTSIIGIDCRRGVRLVDVRRVLSGEVIWLGVFWTPLELLSRYCPVYGRRVVIVPNVARTRDVFTLTNLADVKKVMEVYGDTTPDTMLLEDAKSRLAVALGVDAEHIDDSQLYTAALYYKSKSMSILVEQITLVSSLLNINLNDVPVYTGGAGKFIVIDEALASVGLKPNTVINRSLNAIILPDLYGLYELALDKIVKR